MTIKWSTNKNGTHSGIDGDGNQFAIAKFEKNIICLTPDGFSGCSWSARDALAAAMSNKEAARKSWTPQSITLTGPHDLCSEDVVYWTARASTLLGNHANVKPATPIYFNRHNWTGGLGVIYPIGPDTFTIKDVDGNWLMTKTEDFVIMTDKETREYHGYKSNGNYYFAEMGCEREDPDPRVAFAQMMYNL